MTQLRLAFMGTPEFAVPSLAALIASGHDVVAVYSQPPRPKGRGHRPQNSPIAELAATHALEIRAPEKFDAPAIEAFAALKLDAAVVVAYGLLLPKAILNSPRLGCVNVHASLLPRWRGAAPIERAILAGDKATGISIMLMDEGLDTGPVLLTASTPIEATTTAGELHDRLAQLGPSLLIKALDGLAAGTIIPKPQPTTGAIYAKKLKREEGAIDWRRPAAEIERAVRALNPRPGVWFDLDGERVKLWAAAVVDSPRRAEPGSVLDAAPTIACGEGALRLLTLQRQGRAAMSAEEFQRGRALPVGTVLPCTATS